VFKFSEEPVTVPRSPYYLDRLRDGDLVPADAETLQLVGEGNCRFPSLAAARADGIAKFEAEFGPDTFKEAFPALAGVSAPASVAPQAAPAVSAGKPSKSTTTDGASS
jgi:hypothetical protein